VRLIFIHLVPGASPPSPLNFTPISRKYRDNVALLYSVAATVSPGVVDEE
jgi:hypothetical protein